jgi:hypothetical protein
MHDARGGLLILQTIVLTAVAMLAFAANSLLCRLALQRGEIDPVSFAGIRLVSGAIVLAVIVRFRSERPAPGHADWLAAAMLFVYVAFFSFAYLTLSAGTGALILFGAVQLTMFSVGLRSGEKFGSAAWLGLALAVAGLVYLVSPGIAAPPLVGAALMAIAGVAWGARSDGGKLRAGGSACPLAERAFHRQRPRLRERGRGRPGDCLRRADVRHRVCHLVCGAEQAYRHASRHCTVVGAADRCIWRSGVPLGSDHAAPGCGFRNDSWWYRDGADQQVAHIASIVPANRIPGHAWSTMPTDGAPFRLR